VNWWILGGVIAVVVLLAIAHRLGWVDFSNKARNGHSHGSAMGIGDEVFHPTRHEAQIELERQTVLPAPAPLAGDGDKGIFNGKVVIDLSKGPKP
jgi:hypothetical protein